MFFVYSKCLSKMLRKLPLTPTSSEKILNTSSEMVDLNYWFKAEQRPLFMLCLTMCLISSSS